ncbi:MAG: hypothetical protein K9N46_07935 [Candidatus Marinimicrobia bacterium]|nr:hypothetical protein [Candidatus Neomarinimicrobiota bacterium]MCF7828736.1 hypothetical protein [Candidatus Neomarinimicrobiota bacterium]MCF7880653.1 hypothetical protein [Candidatus Neomarinimicrobiota bacterium]
MIDAIWGLLVIYFYFKVTFNTKTKIRISKNSKILLTISIITIISLTLANISQNRIVLFSDFLESYRYFYYFLVLNAGFQLNWTKDTLERYLISPIIVAVIISGAISILAALSPLLAKYISKIYLLKSTYGLPELQSISGPFRIRISGTFGNPNHYGVALNIVLPFLFYRAKLKTENLEKAIYYLLILFNLILIISTGSRTAMVGAIIQLPFLSMINYKGSRSLSISYSKLILVILVFSVLFKFTYDIFSRVNVTVNQIMDIGLLGVDSLRIKFEWSMHLLEKVLSEAPFFGFGPSEQYGSLFGDNQISATLYRFGLVGILLYLLFWFNLLYILLKNSYFIQYINIYTFIMICVFMLFGLTGKFFDATQITTFLFLIVGVILQINSQKKEFQS